jgi:hypothetical protein
MAIGRKTSSIVVHQRLALGWRCGAASSHGEESSPEEGRPGQGDCRNEARRRADAIEGAPELYPEELAERIYRAMAAAGKRWSKRLQ